MTNVNGVNVAKPMTQVANDRQGIVKDNIPKSTRELDRAIQDGLTGADRKEVDKSDTLTPNEKKELIKYYREQGYSKKEAEAIFNSKADKLDKMSRKEAKSWLKDYMAENGCSKKEAKAAFKEQFGYSVPLSMGQQMLRFTIIGPLGAVGQFADQLSGGKLGLNKFVTGQGNNDAAYVKKQQ